MTRFLGVITGFVLGMCAWAINDEFARLTFILGAIAGMTSTGVGLYFFVRAELLHPEKRQRRQRGTGIPPKPVPPPPGSGHQPQGDGKPTHPPREK